MTTEQKMTVEEATELEITADEVLVKELVIKAEYKIKEEGLQNQEYSRGCQIEDIYEEVFSERTRRMESEEKEEYYNNQNPEENGRTYRYNRLCMRYTARFYCQRRREGWIKDLWIDEVGFDGEF